MIFPPELVDEILIHLRHDKQALQNCSLVAKSWTYSGQKHLYTDIRITPSTYRIWQEIASPTSAELLRHAHSLICYQSQSLHDFHEDYFKSFHRLQFLSLERIRDIDLDAVHFFLAFQNSLSSLSLIHVSLALGALIKLLGYFPNLRKLYLNELTFCAEHRTTPPPSIPPRGKLSLSTFSAKNADILLRCLCELELEYDELYIYKVHGNILHIHSVVSACAKTLTHLKLGHRNRKLQSSVTASWDCLNIVLLRQRSTHSRTSRNFASSRSSRRFCSRKKSLSYQPSLP